MHTIRFKFTREPNTLMGEIVLLGAYQKRLFANLPPDERHMAENLIRAAPLYRYDLSGLPKLNPPPAPGPASAAAAAKAMVAWIRSRRFD